ncbi:hypothetical protein Dimus_023226 [Dionaea muscipula]
MPRKRGRPKKSKVIVEAVATAGYLPRSTLFGTEQVSKFRNLEEADRLWNFCKKLGLVSATSDEVTIEKITELLADGDKGKNRKRKFSRSFEMLSSSSYRE